MRQRDYGKTRHVSRVVMQILLDFGGIKGVSIDLIPYMTIAILNRDVYFAVGFSWICGTINFGFARQSYIEYLDNRTSRIKQEAQKLGVTERQYAHQWGW